MIGTIVLIAGIVAIGLALWLQLDPRDSEIWGAR